MNRILLIFFACTVLLPCSCKQKSKSSAKTATTESSPDDTVFMNSVINTLTPDQYRDQLLKKPFGWTNDFEHLFTNLERDELDSMIESFEKETTIQIAVVTIDSSWINAEKFDSLVLAIHKNWGVGQKETNNGIVIGFSTGHQRIRISNGYGIETKLSDAETKEIIDNRILPAFRVNQYFTGTKRGLIALMEKLRLKKT